MTALSKAIKERIRTEALRYAGRFSSQSQCAHALQLNAAQFTTAIKQGQFDGTISDAKWRDIACKLGVSLKSHPELQTAMTKMVVYLVEQFEICQRTGSSGILCDIADSGKTHAAKYYVSTHNNAIRIDCSIYKTKRRLIQEIARQLGVPLTGNYWQQYDSLVWQINNSTGLLIIIDEAGDLDYEAFMELKGLWNATEGNCAWFRLGADGLKRKMEQGLESNRVGFSETYSRHGAKYQRCLAESGDALKIDVQTQAALIAKQNTPPGTDIQKLVLESGGSLRRLRNLIETGKYSAK